jgi:uncharacterized protein
MKLSKYNWLHVVDNKQILFNAFSGALCELDEDTKKAVIPMLTSNKSIEEYISGIDDNTMASLIKGGYVISDEYDEDFIIKTRTNVPRFSPHPLAVTAVMTENCNFACKYCYENLPANNCSNSKMSSDVIDAIVNVVKSSTHKFFELILFGGEPLLALDKCIELSGKAQAAAIAKGMGYGSFLISNGFLLDEVAATNLSKVGVNYCQITIDGNETIHNSTRPLKSGAPTFSQIIENVKTASKYMRIAVRVTVDTDISPIQEKDIASLKSMFKGYSNVSIYCAPVNWDYCDDSTRTDVNYGYISSKVDKLFYASKKLSSVSPGCTTLHLSSLTVCPDGRLVRCFNEVTDKNISYGNILDSPYPDLSSSKRWLEWYPQDLYSNCAECRMFPSCGGGCPFYAISNGYPRCKFQNKDQYLEYIEINYRLRKDQTLAKKGGE